ncbi:hypothetical protein BC629DRAFT_413511 [Irpex lacteus]|nr:hypothetical protein BC629DRAFT_413511 [Irpex lacteus]
MDYVLMRNIGHEADYVIVSTTRTTSPGFLRTQSRTNVMLTRCKAGMIIVSNSFFVSRCAERTLLGKLAAHWEGPRNSTKIWTDWRQVSEGSIDLPGSRAPHPRPKKSQSARVPPPSRSVAPPPVANLEPSQLIFGNLNTSSTISGFSTSSTPSSSSPRPTPSTALPPVAKPFDTRRLFGSIDSIEATSNYSVPSTPSTSSLQSLPEQMSRLSMRRQSSNKPKPRRVDDPDFPEIPNLDPPTSQRPLQGQWRQGSKPVRLG